MDEKRRQRKANKARAKRANRKKRTSLRPSDNLLPAQGVNAAFWLNALKKDRKEGEGND